MPRGEPNTVPSGKPRSCVTLNHEQMEEVAAACTEFQASKDQYCHITVSFMGGRDIRLDFCST